MMVLRSSFVAVFSIFSLTRGFDLGSDLSSQLCYTTHGTQSIKGVPTSSYTVTNTATKTIVHHVQPTVTVTPDAFTTTTTALSTLVKIDSAGKETGTATVTKTAMDNVTKTSTKQRTTTKTITITKTTQSMTIATLSTTPGFIPVSSSLPGSQNAQKLIQQQQSKPKLLRQKTYPQNVDCRVVETVTTTVTSTTTDPASTFTLEAATSLLTTTQITTSTTTLHPLAQAHTTSTLSTTTTITQTTQAPDKTITKTKTTTTTEFIPGPTYYEACSPSNQMQRYRGKIIDDAFPSSGTGSNPPFVYVDTRDLYTCCVACFNAPHLCATGIVFSPQIGNCALSYNADYKCPPQRESRWEADTCGYGEAKGVFNGGCGSYTSYSDVGC